ncbi:MAG: hypothetical protein ACYTET_07525, partial [Planctomycetota bacterium]
VNYNTGDGIEKAFTLANIIHARNPELSIEMDIDNHTVIVRAEGEYTFTTTKNLTKQLKIENGRYEASDE